MQSRFLYENLDQKVIRIQGLAGTGKTELLLHKLSAKIVFTCYNIILAKEILVSIPQFFNFMKIEEQIECNTRLLVFASWGSQFAPLSGLYSYICSQYGLKFYRLSDKNNFDEVCKEAVDELKNKQNLEKCFDYVFIDESQDFTPSFFEMYKMVTKQKLYIVGDVFQNIFDTKIKFFDDIDYPLNKCYRTDPRTLMIAHSIGMGLYETPVIRWFIRNLIYALSTVIKVTQYLIVFPYRDISCKSSDADITIWIDKMSRIFLNSDNKIHCLNYPFTVYEQNGILQFYCLNKKIDGMLMDIILSILKRFDFIQKSIESTLDCFFEVMEDFSVNTNSDMQFYWNLLTYLITQESGYLRYDHDEITDTILYRVNHIDFFVLLRIPSKLD